MNTPTLKPNWKREFPKTEGWYWFYGYRYAGESRAELAVMQVFKESNGLIYVVNGNFYFPNEAGDFMVLLMEEPLLPMMAPCPLISWKEANK